MTIGSVLLQPQRIRRAAAEEPLAALLDDLAGLAVRAIEDPEAYAPLLGAVGDAFTNLALRLWAQLETGLVAASASVSAWLAPLAGEAQTLAAALGSGDGAAVTQALLALVGRLARYVESLTIREISRQVGILLDALQKDLGLTNAYLEAQVWQFFDDIITRLEQPVPGENAAGQEDRLAAAAPFRRLRRLLRAEASALPQLNADIVAQALLQLLQRSGAAGVLHQIACVGQDVGAVAGAGGALLRLVAAAEEGTPSGAPEAAPATIAVKPLADGDVGANPALRGHQALFVRDQDGQAGASPLPRSEGGAGSDLNAGGTATPLPLRSLATPPRGTAPPPPAAGGGQFSWYGNWLLGQFDTPLFGLGDLKKPQEVISQTKTGSTPFFSYLRTQLKAETTQALNAFSSGDPPKELQTALLVEFNRLIQGPSLYDEARFKDTKLKDDTQKAIKEAAKEAPKGTDLVEFNRMLFEDAFGDNIKPQPRGKFFKFLAVIAGALLDLIKWPKGPLQVDDAAKYVMFDDRPLYSGAGATWPQASIFAPGGNPDGSLHYVFGSALTPGVLDQVAYWTALAVDLGRLIWHLTYIQTDHQISPVWFAGYDLAGGLTKSIKQKPYSALFSGGKWLEFQGVPLAGMLFTAIQGNLTDAGAGRAFKFWLSSYIGDYGSLTGPDSLDGYRDMLLALLTLLNNRLGKAAGGAATPRPDDNYRVVGPFGSFAGDGFATLLAMAIPRKDFGVKGLYQASYLLIWLLAVPAACLLACALAIIAGDIFAGNADSKVFTDTLKSVLPKVMLKFPLTYMSVKGGDTDDGKYNPLGPDFAGYPSKSAAPSPYLLPWTRDKTFRVGDGNQAFSAHNYLADENMVQVYAYGFSLEPEEVILASRSGTIVDFQESHEENSAEAFNFILLRNDLDDDGKPLNDEGVLHKTHDRDAGGEVVRTYSEYRMCRKTGVTDALKLWQPAATPKAGLKVKRGQPIMISGDEDFQLHVRPEDPGPHTPKNYTVPFVFQDVDGNHGAAPGGKWLTSKNERRNS